MLTCIDYYANTYLEADGSKNKIIMNLQIYQK